MAVGPLDDPAGYVWPGMTGLAGLAGSGNGSTTGFFQIRCPLGLVFSGFFHRGWLRASAVGGSGKTSGTSGYPLVFPLAPQSVPAA